MAFKADVYFCDFGFGIWWYVFPLNQDESSRVKSLCVGVPGLQCHME